MVWQKDRESTLKNLVGSLHVKKKICLGKKVRSGEKHTMFSTPDIPLRFLGSVEREEDTIKLVS